MRSSVIIISLFLSFIFGEGKAGNASDINRQYTYALVESTDNGATDRKADFNDVAILPVRTATVSGNSSSFAPSFRSTHSGRRAHSSFKSSFRIVKEGKVFDRNNFHTFQTVILQFQSGIHSNSRYIYSICQLLI